MPADRGTTALVAACFRAGAVLVASITQRWQHCLHLKIGLPPRGVAEL
jgi:hypothetical protein